MRIGTKIRDTMRMILDSSIPLVYNEALLKVDTGICRLAE